MTTRAIVPNADGEGSLGVEGLNWGAMYVSSPEKNDNSQKVPSTAWVKAVMEEVYTEAENEYATKTEAGVPYQIKRNTAYKVGDVLTSPSLPPGCVIVVTQAGTTGSTEPDWATIKSNMGG